MTYTSSNFHLDLDYNNDIKHNHEEKLDAQNLLIKSQ